MHQRPGVSGAAHHMPIAVPRAALGAIPCIPSFEPGDSQCAIPRQPPNPARARIALTHLHLLADLYQLGHLVLQFTVAFNQVGEIRLQGLLRVQKQERRKRQNKEISKAGPPSATETFCTQRAAGRSDNPNDSGQRLSGFLAAPACAGGLCEDSAQDGAATEHPTRRDQHGCWLFAAPLDTV